MSMASSRYGCLNSPEARNPLYDCTRSSGQPSNHSVAEVINTGVDIDLPVTIRGVVMECLKITRS